MNKILGRIFTILIISTTMFASVKALVNKDAIYAGDNINYTISADGKNPQFPNIDEIGGYSILGVSTSQNVNIVNGNYKSTTSKIYTFAPLKNVIIPSYEVSVNGTKYKTKTIEIKVLKPVASKSDGDFSIRMSLDKDNVFVGEPIKLDVKFKYKIDASADKISIGEPKISNFWIKNGAKPIKSMENDSEVQTYHYLIFPQKSGNFKITPVVANIGTAVRSNMGGGNIFNDPFFNAFNTQIRWKKIFSNELSIHVKPLPNNLEVYGSYNIKASVDKSVVNANKPVNLTIKIVGTGNIDDVRKFPIDINNVVEYSAEPVIKSGLNAGKYGGVFTQKVALIANNDFTIPSFKFTYFDKNLNKAVTEETKPISIKVKGGSKVFQAPKIDVENTIKTNEKPQVVQKIIVSKSSNYLYLLLGFVLGILVTLGFIILGKKDKTKKEIPILKKIQKVKSDKELFEVLLPYQKDDDFIKSILEKLETNIYSNGKNKISKKELIQYFLDIE